MIQWKNFLKKNAQLIIAGVSLIFFIVFSFTKTGKTVELSFYDALLHFKSAPKEREEVLLLSVDDLAIEQVGSWPWSRDIMADVLLKLREFGATTAVFDIEYLSPGQSGVNKTYVENDLPKAYQSVRQEMDEYITQFSAAIAEKNIPAHDAPEFADMMKKDLDERMQQLSDAVVENIFRDNDTYLGQAINFFGNTFVTINAANVNVNTEDAELKNFACEHFLFENITDTKKLFKTESQKIREENSAVYGISPAIMPVLQYAKGAGFPNVVIDTDGVRRRIQLFTEYNGKYVAQLVLSPILNILKPEQIIRNKRSLILKNCTHPDFNQKQDIKIPLDANGCLMINWLKKNFLDANNPENTSFKNISIYVLIYADKIENNLVENLHNIADLKIRTQNGYLQYDGAVQFLLDSYQKIQQQRSALLSGESAEFDAYFAERNEFFQNVDEFLKGDFEAEIHQLFTDIQAQTGTDEYTAFDSYVADVFKAARSNYALYRENEQVARANCKDAFAIIGYSGVGTSDLGVNPFWASYPNVGTHANIYNTIMSGQFITPLPFWLSIVCAVLFVFFTALVLSKLSKVFAKLLFGILMVCAIFIISVFLFSFFGIYARVVLPMLSVSVCFLGITFFDFLFAEKEKSFLRKAFGVYLSKNVVDEIVKDPSKLALGGEEKRITALFTDIRSFSTLSEKITPTHLVQVLNEYLTIMSDLIFEERGTVDKYIGDAIVSFFGAPLDVSDHAACACRAAVKMKAAEAVLNQRLFETGEIPMPIHTRIGINTGQMVVGNMGTDTKMNYTIMGNDVNLAARLEGVNKVYGSWILVSQSTWEDTHGEFLGRRFDRVRVVGINTPVQLYNIMSLKSNASDRDLELVDRFEKGIDKYRERDYAGALQTFESCLEVNPDDAPSKVFIQKLAELVANPELAKTHDDVVNMTSK